MRVKGLTLVVHSHSRTAISIAHGLREKGLAGGVFWRKRGASFRPFTAVSGTEPAPGLSKGANGKMDWPSPRTGEGMGSANKGREMLHTLDFVAFPLVIVKREELE